MTEDNALRDMETTFLESWDTMEAFYTDLKDTERFPWIVPTRQLIAAMRERGYDKRTRGARLFDAFVLARSRQPVLREGQQYIIVALGDPQGTMHLSYMEFGEALCHVEVARIAWAAELEALLARLLERPID